MPRVIGIDAGTVSLDICGLEDGRVFLERSMPTAEALAAPDDLVRLVQAHQPLDLVVAPSGYGLPVTWARDLTEEQLRLAFPAVPGDTGGIGGLRTLIRAFAAAPLPVMLTPGVIHLNTVPAHRKVNRVDMGTADKVCAAALALRDVARRLDIDVREASFVLLEAGGAFTAALAIDSGRIVDGVGGTSGPLGAQAAGALDGEVAFLAGTITKRMLFGGGVAAIGGDALAWTAYRESGEKAVAAMLAVSAPAARGVVVTGRHADRFPTGRGMHLLGGFATAAKSGAQGAALLADGLAGGEAAAIVERLGIREASGTVLDHLHVISPAAARLHLGLGGSA